MVNDMTILGGFVVFFLIVGLALPFLNAEFNQSDSEVNPSYVSDNQNPDDLSSISAWSVIKSVFLMFFWTFGSLPLTIELLIFEPIRIIGYVIVARNIWIGGGG
jgi:hypothetical protein